jgi:hypothetical protein
MIKDRNEDLNEDRETQLVTVDQKFDVELKVDRRIGCVYDSLKENIIRETGVPNENDLWYTILCEGSKNMPSFSMPGLLWQYQMLGIRISSIYHRLLETTPMDFSLESESIIRLRLTADVSSGIEYFGSNISIGHMNEHTPYIMLLTSFIYSNYAECLKEYRDAVEPFWDVIHRHIENTELEIYNATISILTKERFFIIPERSHHWINYLNYFTEHFVEQISEYNKRDINKIAALIANYCMHVQKYLYVYKEVNPEFSEEEFNKLKSWAENQCSLNNVNSMVVT